MNDTHSRTVPLYVLIHYKNTLLHLQSFSENISGCNFSICAGWNGKSYVEHHQVGEHKPTLAGTAILKIYHINLEDTITLTEDQYNDFVKITLLGTADHAANRHRIIK